VTSDDRKPKAAHPKSRRTLAIAGGVIGLLLIVGAAGLFWYLNQPVPDEVSIESAVADVASSQPPATDVTATDVTETAGSETRLDGTWIVDTSIGDFSFEEATSSFVGFRIKEELATVGATTAVGRTPVLEGSLALDGATISNLTVEADLSQIVTNASRRDRAVQRALDTGSFPIATFILTAPIDIGVIPAEDESVPVVAVGDLEIKGVTKSIEIPLETQLVGDLIVVVGAVDITFADWGVEMPSAPGVVSVEDHGILEIQLFFSRA
jgi:polyisoprenoid-binding protein YceI